MRYPRGVELMLRACRKNNCSINLWWTHQLDHSFDYLVSLH